MYSARFSKQSKRVVRIKRFFSILIITALLFGFSSCGTKGSSNVLTVDFSKATPALMVYNGVEYKCDLCFNGNVLTLNTRNKESETAVGFTVDSLTCTITHAELKKVYETEKLPDDFLPVKLFDFFNSNGVVLELKLNKKTGEAYFDSIIDEPYIYIDANKNLIFQIK